MKSDLEKALESIVSHGWIPPTWVEFGVVVIAILIFAELYAQWSLSRVSIRVNELWDVTDNENLRPVYNSTISDFRRVRGLRKPSTKGKARSLNRSR